MKEASCNILNQYIDHVMLIKPEIKKWIAHLKGLERHGLSSEKDINPIKIQGSTTLVRKLGV